MKNPEAANLPLHYHSMVSKILRLVRKQSLNRHCIVWEKSLCNIQGSFGPVLEFYHGGIDYAIDSKPSGFQIVFIFKFALQMLSKSLIEET
jgi:hypothetical protein